MAAPAPEYLVLSNGGTMLAMLRTTKASPGWKSKMWEGHTLESEQANTINFGLWPLASSPYSSGFFLKRGRTAPTNISVKCTFPIQVKQIFM